MSGSTLYVLWHYRPNLIVAVVACAVFALLSIGHIIYRFFRGTKFTTPLIVGTVFETAGYAARAYAHFNKNATTPYAIQSLLILLAPILCAASVYMCLGHHMRSSNTTHLSPIPAKFLTKIFVAGDVTCFLIQGAGGGILSGAKKQSQINVGNDVILVGLIVQIVLFLGFIVTASIFHARLRRLVSSVINTRMSRQLYVLYVISGLIMVRNLYRMLEYALGQDGYLINHEWVLYVFDALPISMVLAAAFSWHVTWQREEICEEI